MKKILLFLIFFISINAFSQEDAWVYFSDKPDFQTYYDNPLLMLSQRALDRRTNQNIAIDMKDVPVYQSYIDQVASSNGITVMAKSKWLNALHIRGTIASINALTAFSFVSNVVFADKSLNASGKSKKINKTKSTNKKFDVQVNFAYGSSANQIQMLNGQTLHQQNYTGSGKIIAVLDAGFPNVNTIQPFAKIRNNNQILGGYNFVDRSTNYYTANFHGTMVLSTMAGYKENQLVGTAPDASYYLFITEDAATENPVEESLWVEAAETADSLGVDVINTSLGYFTYDNPNYSYTYEDMNGTTSFISRGADIAFSRGMVVVVSAGNSGASDDPHISVPADAVNVLTVGAVDPFGQYASFSSIGPSFDGRVKPDVMAQGQSSVVADPSGNIVTANGTSFSGPITAGMVASLWQALPNKTNAEIVQLIKQSASIYDTPDEFYGYGIPDFGLALTNALEVTSFKDQKFQLYPNPAKSTLNFTFPDGIQSASITIYNNLGQVVSEKNVALGSSSISVENLSSGIYIYKIQSQTLSQTGKLIKK